MDKSAGPTMTLCPRCGTIQKAGTVCPICKFPIPKPSAPAEDKDHLASAVSIIKAEITKK